MSTYTYYNLVISTVVIMDGQDMKIQRKTCYSSKIDNLKQAEDAYLWYKHDKRSKDELVELYLCRYDSDTKHLYTELISASVGYGDIYLNSPDDAIVK